MAQPDDSAALHAARRHRRGVRDSLVAIESAAASAATDERWLTALASRVEQLRAAFAHHVSATEGDDGLLAETIEIAPRLARRAQILRDDHVAITRAVDDIALRIAACDGAPTEDDAEALRTAVTDVMGRITRHRQLGADLVFQAYNVDIEGAD